MCEFIMVGCDLHDSTMLLEVAAGRQPAETLSMRNTRAGRGRMIVDLLERSRHADGAKVIFAYEASGQGFGLHDELTDAGVECHVLAPTKIARSAQHKREKTDEKDAEQILQLLRAHVLAGNPLPDVWIPDPQTRDDREVVRARLDAAEKVTAVQSQIQGLLKRNRQARPEAMKGRWSKPFWAWLRGLVADPARGSGLRTTLVFLTEVGGLRRFHNRRLPGPGPAQLREWRAAGSEGPIARVKDHPACVACCARPPGAGFVKNALTT